MARIFATGPMINGDYRRQVNPMAERLGLRIA
jgi:hypothetical protein